MNKDCVSLEVAQKLQKAGYKSECENYYSLEHNNVLSNGELSHIPTNLVGRSFYLGTSPKDEFIPAPTATQLAEELKNFNPNIRIWWSYPDWRIAVISDDGTSDVRSESLPDALGLMRVYLLENKLI